MRVRKLGPIGHIVIAYNSFAVMNILAVAEMSEKWPLFFIHILAYTKKFSSRFMHRAHSANSFEINME